MGQEEETVLRIAKHLASKDFPRSHWSYLSLEDKQELLDEARTFYEGCKKGINAYKQGNFRNWSKVKAELGIK